MAKDRRIELLVTAEDREAWQRSANIAGLSLSAYVRRYVDEAQALEHALEGEVERARRERQVREPDRSPPERPRPRPSQPAEQRMGEPRRWGVSVGEALARADRNCGRGPIF